MNARRVLVTGAGGFVCRHIVEALLAGGWRVVALDRAFDPDLRAAWAERVEMIEGSAAQILALNVDALVHGAAITAPPEEAGLTPETYLREHLDAALLLVERAHAANVARVLLISSDAVYSDTPPGLLDEDTPTQPQGLYAVAKAALEHTARALRHQYDRDIAAIRLGSIYGPGELPRPSRPRISRVGQMLHDALTDGRFTLDTAMRTQSWTFAPDVGAAVRALLDAPILHHAVYNVASEEVLTAGEIADAVSAALPNARVVEAHGAPSGDQRRHTLSSRRLRAETGFRAWTPFAQGIAATLTWQSAQLEITP